jgi:hypothetical protein
MGAAAKTLVKRQTMEIKWNTFNFSEPFFIIAPPLDPLDYSMGIFGVFRFFKALSISLPTFSNELSRKMGFIDDYCHRVGEGCRAGFP